MKVSCPSCQTHYKIDDKRIPAGGAKLKCAKCQTTFPIKPEAPPPAAQPSALPLPGLGAGSIPLPGLGLPEGDDSRWDSESTRVMSGPLPGAAFSQPAPSFGGAAASPFSGAIPLPGLPSAESDSDGRWDEESTRVQDLPLPGAAFGAPSQPSAFDLPPSPFDLPPSPFDLPPAGGENHWDDDASTRVQSLPLPGEAFPVPLPGLPSAPETNHWGDEEASTRVQSLPLPGEAFPIPLPGLPSAPEANHWGDEEASTRVQMLPLPGAAFAPEPTRIDEYPPAPPSPAPASTSWDISPEGFELDSAPGSSSETSVDFAEADLMDAAQSTKTQAVPLPSSRQSAEPTTVGMSPFDAPAEKTQAVPSPSFELDFSDLPSPANPPPEEDLPSPAPAAAIEDFSVDFGSPPPPAKAAPPPRATPPPPAPIDFGDVELDGPAPSSDALEFDPTSPSKSSSDDLEADLSAPIPAPSSPATADGLEMLDFIDSAAKEAGAAPSGAKSTRFHIRRRSGKVFGPFDEGVVVKMLEDGQLLGNEDASTDGESWSAIGSVGAFGEVISRLMESPSRANTKVASAPGSSNSDESAKTMNRLKDLYEGRMAAVAVVDGGSSGVNLRQRLPLIIAAAVILLIAGAGASLSATKYGLFGLKALLPAKVSKGTKEFADLEKAQKALLADTFKSYQEARDAAASALRVKEYPQARALWCQAIFYLQRRYAAASPAELAAAKAALDPITLLGKKHPDVVKALAGAALASREADRALTLVDEGMARAEAADDLELSFLRAEAYAFKGQVKLATAELKKILSKDPKSAKAFHALGNLHRDNKDAEEAAKAYGEALEADPKHAISAIELAAVELLMRKEAIKGEAAVEKALGEENKLLLGPAELARAMALRGEALAMQFKLKEASVELEKALTLDPESLYAKAGLGRVKLAQHDWEGAVPLFAEATQLAPANLEYTSGYLTALIQTGKMDDAFKQLESVNARFPGNGRIAYLTGRVNDALDLSKEAESNYIRAANADPTIFEANLHLGRMYLRFRRHADARPQLQTALQKAPEDAAVHTGMGEMALADDDLEGAKSEFKLAITKDPNLADAHLGLSKVALAKGELEAASASVDKALELDSHLKHARLQKGLVLWRLGQLDAAVAELEKAKAADPRSARILVTMGAVKIDKNDLAGAETNLLAALSQEPSNAEAHFYIGRIKSRRMEHTQAIESMRTALEHAPKRPDFHYEMGLIYKEAKRSQEALDEWKEVIELSPDHADALEALGQAYLDRGEFDTSIGYFDRALKAQPGRVSVLALVGDANFQATRWNEAINRYLKALQRDPSLKGIHYKVARAYTEKGKHAEAINWYRKAIYAEPDSSMPYLYLGYAYKEKGQRKDAVVAFKSYLEKKPNAEDKREVEDEIYDLQH